MRKSDLDKYRERQRRKFQQMEIPLLGGRFPAEGLFNLMLPPRVDREGFKVQSVLNPTQIAVLTSDEEHIAFMGNAGSGKTLTGCMAGWGRLLLEPGYQLLIARWDYNKLQDTTVKEMESILHRLPPGTLVDRDKDPPMRWWIQPIAIEGVEQELEPSQVTFMGLKDSLGSYQFHGSFVDEADDVPDEKKMDEVESRCRLPGKSSFFMLSFNPPPKTHWLYPACTGKDFKGNPYEPTGGKPKYTLFRPDPRENAINLKADYYEKLSTRLSKMQRQRLVDGEWGSTFEGKPVYGEFKEEMHGRRGLIHHFNPLRPLLRFWDFGYNHPCCLWAQNDAWGRLLIFREELGECIEARPFGEHIKALTTQHFPQAHEVIDYGDPAVRQKKDTGSTLAQLNSAGIYIRYRILPIDINVSINAVRRKFDDLVSGEPAIQIDLGECPVLADALRGGYRMDDRGEKPFKDGFYDNVADPLRYGIVNVYGLTGFNVVGHEGGFPTSIAEGY